MKALPLDRPLLILWEDTGRRRLAQFLDVIVKDQQLERRSLLNEGNMLRTLESHLDSKPIFLMILVHAAIELTPLNLLGHAASELQVYVEGHLSPCKAHQSRLHRTYYPLYQFHVHRQLILDHHEQLVAQVLLGY